MTQQLIKWTFPGKWITGGFGLTLLLMVIICFVSLKNTDEIKSGANRVQQTYQTLNALTNFYGAMTAAESARRGYIFLGSSQDLQRYYHAKADMRSQLQILQKQIHSYGSQEKRLVSLNLLVNQRLSLLEQSIELYQKDKKSMLIQNNITVRSVQIREKILQVMAEIKAEEQTHLQDSLEQSKQSIYFRILIEIFTTFLILIIILGLCIILEKQWIKREQIRALEFSLAQEKKIGDLKIQLFSMISHEFRTPLSIILLSSQLLKESLETLVDEQHLKNIFRIQSSAKIMNHILTDILILTRAEAGQLDFKLQVINLENFCLNLVEDLQIFAKKANMIRFQKRGSIFKANIDEKLLYSILSNLLLNAIKYSNNETAIYLKLKSEAELITFQVIDQGIGIPLAEQHKIYEPFYRCQNVENIAGTGLGLAVVKKCVELHQGEIIVESKVGTGTTFTIMIPQENT
ncbi:CHASE3 domain-containing protein [Nostoc sp. FACHB-87]|uniref:sensor histidine kinase n=1 Tax=Nostocaceae TaxID=1162 RepID=UPI001685314C|nr:MULTISPECIES: ATP-binding protein [Nostocaceae]MBD2458092.1 CHASE3 domain-containing protein [Nostoc sp. FACHB-87]MBD2477606.1 CHASE3 domain-containing protein [Anabaena sp. FACHB-83]